MDELYLKIIQKRFFQSTKSSTGASKSEARCPGVQFLSESAGKEGQASVLSDRSSHRGSHGPACRRRQLLDLCIQPPDDPLQGFTALKKNKPINRRLVHTGGNKKFCKVNRRKRRE